MSHVSNSLLILALSLASNLSFAAEVLVGDSSLSLRKDNKYTVGMKMALLGASGVVVGKKLYPNTLLEASYLRNENYASEGSTETSSENFIVGARQFFGNSFYLTAGLGLNESQAVLENETLKDYRMDVMYRDLNVRFGIGNRWEMDGLWYIGCEWVALEQSIARLDHESSVASLNGAANNRAAAEAFALKSAKTGHFGSGSLLTLEMGLNF